MKKILLVLLFTMPCLLISQQAKTSVREHISMDSDWSFAYGHAYDTEKDHGHRSAYFSYFAKVGWGISGPSGANFDDRSWRVLDIPHDWAVELPFDARGSHSHGYKAIGRNFPENSVGWYRKTFSIPEADLGKQISIQFDGVFRNSEVWVNGFYCGLELSGYSEFEYNISDYINYGTENVVAVRVDATMEEGWFYEGAGIYRHVWLNKTGPLHIDTHGIFVASQVKDNSADIAVSSTIINENQSDQNFEIKHTIIDSKGSIVATKTLKNLSAKKGNSRDFSCNINIDEPRLWSLKNPILYKLLTTIMQDESVIDNMETTFGIRTIQFDPDKGFFLNGKHVLIKGTNNHQDHAGVGAAIPDALQEYRILRLKEMGSNAYRTSHNPPTPEFLDACDRLGMLVLDENRLMGSSQQNLKHLKTLIKRDRNHPCVIAWSIGNEEWGIEGNIKGTRIASTMQTYAKQFDQTRPVTVAASGGWGDGVSVPIELMGFNYLSHGNIDEHHKNFPNQPAFGTEETTTQGTRGIYEDDRPNGHMAPTDRSSKGGNIEIGITYYAERPFLAGLFFWTGFDYRGEPNPLNFPAVSSQFGLLDLCGFFKDPAYYLQAWWGEEPVLHLSPHWNWPDKEGQEINVWAQSNCDEVELFLNGKSLGRKAMEKYSHLEWNVAYEPGTLMAEGFKNAKKIINSKVETTQKPSKLELSAHKNQLNADGKDVSVIKVQTHDSKGRFVATTNQQVAFSIEGPGKIIGVGNGDPASHEPDKYFETVNAIKINNIKELAVENLLNRPEVEPEFDDTQWKTAFKSYQDIDWRAYTDSFLVVRGTIELPEVSNKTEVNLFSKSIVENQSIYINGHLIAANIMRDAPGQSYRLDHSIIKPGKNIYAVVGKRFKKAHQWDEPNTDPGMLQIVKPADQWKRNLFNGLAQVIVQSSDQPGEIALTAKANGLENDEIKIQVNP